MKKLLLFSALCMAAVSTISAQVVEGNLGTGSASKEMLTKKELPTVGHLVFSKERANLPSTRALSVKYARPDGTYYPGVEPIKGSVFKPMIVGGGYSDWTFKNLSQGGDDGVTYSWSIDSAQLPDSVLKVSAEGNLTIPMPLTIVENTPILKAKGSATGSYQFGSTVTTQGEKPDARFMAAGIRQYFPLTSADYNYGGFYATLSTKNEAGEDLSGYAFGTKVLGGAIDASGTIVLFKKPMTPLYVRGVSAMLYTKGSQIMPTNGVLRMEVREIDSEGQITDKVLASGEAASKDITVIDESSSSMFVSVYFTFQEKDDKGVVLTYDYVLDKTCAIVISGWEGKEGYDFGFLFAREVDQVGKGTAYNLLSDGKIHAYPADDSGDGSSNDFNIYVQLDAIYNCLTVAPELSNLRVPDEGGLVYGTYQGQQYDFIQLNLSPVSDESEEADIEQNLWIEGDLPEWLEIAEVDGSQWDKYGVALVSVNGEALPAGVTGRTGEITFGSWGVTATAVINQGPDAIASEVVNTVKAVANGNNFDLTYSEGMTSVKVMNTAGQLISTYDLPASGSFTVSASGLADGLYILQFAGEKTATVKVMK